MYRSPVLPDTKANRSLLRAIHRNCLEDVNKALLAGADPNAFVVSRYLSLLAYSITKESDGIVERLLEAGALPFVMPDRYDKTSTANLSYIHTFMIQVGRGPPERTLRWLKEFPELHTSELIFCSLIFVPDDEPELFEALLTAARELPRNDWNNANLSLSSELTYWIADKSKSLEKIRSVYAVIPHLKEKDRVVALCAAIKANRLDVFDWLQSLGTPLHKKVRFEARAQSPYELAISLNRMVFLKKMSSSSEKKFDVETWKKDISLAISNQSKDVFMDLWSNAPLQENEKKSLFLNMRVQTGYIVPPASEPLKVSPLEAVCLSRNSHRVNAWIKLFMALGLTDEKNTAQAAHALMWKVRNQFSFSASYAQSVTKTLRLLDKIGMDWTVLSSWSTCGQEPVTLLELGLSHKRFSPVVSEIMARRQADQMMSSLPSPAPSRSRSRI